MQPQNKKQLTTVFHKFSNHYEIQSRFLPLSVGEFNSIIGACWLHILMIGSIRCLLLRSDCPAAIDLNQVLESAAGNKTKR